MNERKENQANDVEEIMKNKKCTDSASNFRNKETGLASTERKRIKTLPQANYYNMEKVKVELRNMLPTLKPFEVRRFYVPHSEATLLELEENGYKEVASNLKELFYVDEENKKVTDPNTLESKMSFLKNQKDLVDCLSNCFIAVEEAGRIGDYKSQSMALLNAALFFESKMTRWRWVAENLYQRALAYAEYIQHDYHYTITLIKYLYGRFLFLKMDNLENALEYLTQARELSEAERWNASRIIGRTEATIFKECNILLFKVLLALAQKISSEDTKLAIKACSQALARAMDSEHDEYIIQALYELGKNYLQSDDIKQALHHFSKFLAIAKRIPDTSAICDAHLKLAFAYKQLDDNINTERHLSEFRQSASKFGLQDKLACAHYYTGEHYLSQGKPGLSTSHLEVALSLYNLVGLREEADQTRTIAGISKGQEIIKQYHELIFKCGECDSNAILKIWQWKNSRQPFWTSEDNA